MNIDKNITLIEEATASTVYRDQQNNKRVNPSPKEMFTIWNEIVGRPNDVRVGKKQVISPDGGKTEFNTYSLYSFMTTKEEKSEDNYTPTIGMIVKSGIQNKIVLFSGMHNVRYCLNLCIWGNDSKITLNSFNKEAIKNVITTLKSKQEITIQRHKQKMNHLTSKTYSDQEYSARFFNIIDTMQRGTMGKFIPNVLKANRHDQYTRMPKTDRRIFECITDTFKKYSPGELLENTEKVQSLFF